MRLKPIERPPETYGTAEDQIRSLKSYLNRLIDGIEENNGIIMTESLTEEETKAVRKKIGE